MRNITKRARYILSKVVVIGAVYLVLLTKVGAQTSPVTPSGDLPPEAASSSQSSATPAPGAADQAGSAAEAERVIVTGSNIPTAEEVGPNPVLNINRDLIDKAGERNAETLIRNLPVANANGVPTSNNNTGFTPGASSVSLRGFDPSATLVLVDGRRVAPYPVGQGGTQAFIDLNSIPRAAIDSIEILKDGASTTYGADAVAGVVNIKLRHDYRGAESTVEYGNTLDKDGGQFSADLLFGVGDDKTQVVGVINYYHQNSIANRDRAFTSSPPFLSTNSSPFNLELSKAAIAAAGGTVLPGDSPVQFAHSPDFSNGLAPASDYVYFPQRGSPGTSLFNFNQFALALPSSERYGGFVNAEHKWFGEQVVIYGDMFYENVKTHNELAPIATGAFQTAGQVTLAIPPHSPNPAGTTPFGGPTYTETGVTPGAFNPFNPFEQIISGDTHARLAEFGNRILNNETDAFLATLGVKGDKLFDGNWGYDAGFRYSQTRNSTINQFVSATRFNRILNAADPIFDPTSPDYIGTTTPYNPFGDYRNPIPSNSATIDFATVHPHEIDTSKLMTLDLNVYTTQLFKLPAGGVGFAFGGQFRRESTSLEPDETLLSGDELGVGKASTVHAGRKDYAFYAETSVPIFSPENSVFGFRALEFTAAGRFEAFKNNDTNVIVPKIGLRWQPFDETLTIRSTWGEGFREPSLFELYQSPTFALSATNDPLTGHQERETPVRFSGNPNLQPEDARSLSAGFVWTPRLVEGLTVSVDFWGIERTGVVEPPTANQVLAREAAGSLLPGEVVNRGENGFISSIFFTFQNAGQERARGIDFGLQYQRQTPYGTFTSLTQATYVDSFRIALTQGDPALEAIRQDSTGVSDDAWLQWKGISRLDWTWKGIDIVGTCRYTDGFHEILFTGAGLPDNKKEHWVHQTFFFDAQGSYDFSFVPPVEPNPVAGYSKDTKEVVRGKDGKAVESASSQTSNYSLPVWQRVLNNTSITVGCNNVFGQDPPKAFGNGFSNSNGFPGFIYDVTGRFVYVSLTKKF